MVATRAGVLTLMASALCCGRAELRVPAGFDAVPSGSPNIGDAGSDRTNGIESGPTVEAGCARDNACYTGMCESVLGIFWDGNQCYLGSGCHCIGDACALAATWTYADCRRAHAGCPTDASVPPLCPDAATCPHSCMVDESGVARCVPANDIPGC